MTDTLAEQELLENLIEETKPVIRQNAVISIFSWPHRSAMAPPIRLDRASGARAAHRASTMRQRPLRQLLRRWLFYRLLFYAESPATPWPSDAAEYTAFSAAITTTRMLDLTIEPLSEDSVLWLDLLDYSPCQALADTARLADADVIRYQSVRDPGQGSIWPS